MSKAFLQPKIFACTNSKALGEKIAAAFGEDLGNVITSTYSDGEFQPSYEESIRGTRIFIIASTNPGPENLMELLLENHQTKMRLSQDGKRCQGNLVFYIRVIH